jgi:uncharacterized protein
MGAQAGDKPGKTLGVSGPGRLQLGPGRVLLMRPETLAELQRGVEDRLGPKAPEYLYSAGSAWAQDAARRTQAATGEEGAELARLVCQQATELGWGEWRVEAFRAEEKGLAVRVLGSPFAEAYGTADTPACHLVAGAVGGLTEFLFHVPAPCMEQACLVQGAPGCLFVAAGQEVDAADSWSW